MYQISGCPMANRSKVRVLESPGGKTTIEAYSPGEHSNGESMYHHIKVIHHSCIQFFVLYVYMQTWGIHGKSNHY